MKLSVCVLFLSVILTTDGLVCFKCEGIFCSSSYNMEICSSSSDQCRNIDVNGIVTRGCTPRALCLVPGTCCNTFLCNDAKHVSTTSVFLLLLSSSLSLLFL